jgi:hypothetical protein
MASRANVATDDVPWSRCLDLNVVPKKALARLSISVVLSTIPEVRVDATRYDNDFIVSVFDELLTVTLPKA